ASGNVTTEDLVFMLERMGATTGIDVTALLKLRHRVAGWLAGETLHGTLWPRTAAGAGV
ncbi:MAG: hydroxymethylglutaryl-CoA lyase, partial [Planctomycetaceae bacterium]